MNRIYKKYFSKLPIKAIDSVDALHLLTENERLALKSNYNKALLYSALLGAFGVIFYFLPIHLFPNLFPKINLNQWFSFDFELEYGQILYGLILMVLELHFLVLVNLIAVHKMAVITGYYNASILNNKEDFLFQLGMDAKELGLNQYGIDPYQEVNKNLLFFFNLMLKLKGFVANKLLQYLVKRLLGRYAVRFVVDYVGIPVYMAINAYGTHLVLSKTKVCIMGSNLIDDFIKNLDVKSIEENEKELIYDTLQLIAMSKRDYHQNHYLLTQAIFTHFDIKPKEKHVFTTKYYENLAKTNQNIQKLCNELLIFGFILDGKISKNESRKIKTLNQLGLLKQTFAEFKVMNTNFLNGVEIGLV